MQNNYQKHLKMKKLHNKVKILLSFLKPGKHIRLFIKFLNN
jgi:hypothetical protein